MSGVLWEKDLLNIREHMSSTPVFGGVYFIHIHFLYLVFWVVVLSMVIRTNMYICVKIKIYVMIKTIVFISKRTYIATLVCSLGFNHLRDNIMAVYKLLATHEVIDIKLLRSSSQSGWPLKNIHISNDNGSFTFYLGVFFSLSLPRLFTGLDCIYE